MRMAFDQLCVNFNLNPIYISITALRPKAVTDGTNKIPIQLY